LEVLDPRNERLGITIIERHLDSSTRVIVINSINLDASYKFQSLGDLSLDNIDT